jgi:hypothetical protein
MRFLYSILIVAVLSAVAEYFLPWWSMAVVCFLVAIFMKWSGRKSFLMGFCGVGMLWLILALLRDVALFHLPNYGLFILVTVIIGGLVGGLAAWAGALLSPKAVTAK